MTKPAASTVYKVMLRENGATRDAAALSRALQELAAGDIDALERVWAFSARDLYGLALWRTGVREDAEDAVQEVFVRLARSPHAAAQAHKPKAYLLSMAYRAATDVFRQRHRQKVDAPASLMATGSDPARTADAERASRLLHELPPKQREVVYLRHFQELSFGEIGRVVGVSLFTAASRYRLALRRLRRLMGEVEK